LLPLPVVYAAEPRTGEVVTVPGDEVVNDDLYVLGNIVVVEGEVNGDVIAIGETVVINGTVNGSVWSAARVIQIPGRVTGSVHLAAQYVAASGRIGRDLQVAAQMLVVPEGALISGDLLMTASDASIHGAVGRDIRGGGSRITIDGPVAGNVEVEAQNVLLDSNAAIGGSITYTSQNGLDERVGAKVAKEKIRYDPEQIERERQAAEPWTNRLPGIGLALLMALVFGLVLTLASPNPTAEISYSILRHPWSSLGWGLVALLGVPPLVLIAAFTIVGIPLSLTILALYLIALYASQIFVGIALGRLLFSRLFPRPNHLLLVVEMVIGLLILSGMREIPLPYAGQVVTITIIIFGLGAAAATHWGQPERPPVRATVTPAPAKPIQTIDATVALDTPSSLSDRPEPDLPTNSAPAAASISATPSDKTAPIPTVGGKEPPERDSTEGKPAGQTETSGGYNRRP
jgi:cytoskeletal protein CcmA (bactofilin family)